MYIECTTAILILLRDVKCERKKIVTNFFYSIKCIAEDLALLGQKKKIKNFQITQKSVALDENAVKVEGMKKNLLQSKVINKSQIVGSFRKK